jgi:hypothetical protein
MFEADQAPQPCQLYRSTMEIMFLHSPPLPCRLPTQREIAMDNGGTLTVKSWESTIGAPPAYPTAKMILWKELCDPSTQPLRVLQDHARHRESRWARLDGGSRTMTDGNTSGKFPVRTTYRKRECAFSVPNTGRKRDPRKIESRENGQGTPCQVLRPTLSGTNENPRSP